MPFKNPDDRRKYNRERSAKRRADAIAEFGGKCQDCGSMDRLEFDHVDPQTKISHKIWTWSDSRMRDELAKCRLKCSKCHWAKTKVDRQIGDPKHGSNNTYLKFRCRCDSCRAAHAAANLPYTRKSRGTLVG